MQFKNEKRNWGCDAGVGQVCIKEKKVYYPADDTWLQWERFREREREIYKNDVLAGLYKVSREM